MKYAKSDVIMWQDDTRLKDGDKYFIGINADDVLIRANSLDESPVELISHNKVGGFQVQSIYSESLFVPVLIKARKETKKKIVPFDLDNAEDRKLLMGKIITNNQTDGTEEMITTFMRNNGKYECWLRIWEAKHDGKGLLNNYVFTDTGEPVGKEDLS